MESAKRLRLPEKDYLKEYVAKLQILCHKACFLDEVYPELNGRSADLPLNGDRHGFSKGG